MQAFTKAIKQFPKPLRENLTLKWNLFCESLTAHGSEQPTPDIVQALLKLWASSDFAADSCVRYLAQTNELILSGDLYQTYDYNDRMQAYLSDVTDEDTLMSAMRRFRQREMLRIAWRDTNHIATLNDTLQDLSSLADSCLKQAIRFSNQWLTEKYGKPCDDHNRVQRLIPIAVGKLGAEELNFSSDIDLIFTYLATGKTQGQSRSINNQEFFVKLAQQVIKILSKITQEGFVFRVDMRLRPFGDGGPLVMSLPALTAYYQEQGRTWERYALVKARVIGADAVSRRQVLNVLNNFTYRRYVDYSVIQSLRDMKAQFTQPSQFRSWQQDVKRGSGGIRQIEFIAQTFQVIRGGRDPHLQRRELRIILDYLHTANILSENAVKQLQEAYTFLRIVENHLQMIADRQTHQLPKDDLSRLRLAYRLGFDDWSSFHKALQTHRRNVANHFSRMIAEPEDTTPTKDSAIVSAIRALWFGQPVEEQVAPLLKKLGYQEPEFVVQALKRLRLGRRYRAIGKKPRSQLDKLIPRIVYMSRCEQTLERMLNLTESILQRGAYLALLKEHSQILSTLCELCGHSAWLAEQVARYPILLDEMLFIAKETPSLEQELKSALDLIPDDDLEANMEALRHFKLAKTLHLSALDVLGRISLQEVTALLTELAERVVASVIEMTYHNLCDKYNITPQSEPPLAILAYGKLGSKELGYGSDLDIVFLHDKNVIDNEFALRLTQRIMHMLTTRTPSGILYQVDTRLRPSGLAGLLVTNIDAYVDYQKQSAWTWEHQALVRARIIYGSSSIKRKFTLGRRTVLTRKRPIKPLKDDIKSMHDKIHQHSSRLDKTLFDLKYDPGGIADIEFIVQYGVLAWAHRAPDILYHTNTLDLLQSFQEHKLMPKRDCQWLQEAYNNYLTRANICFLQNNDVRVDAKSFSIDRDNVCDVWQRMFDEEQHKK